ncbi:MAG: hypothetical protein WC889_20400, partial [Myxococcota bacterium]
SFTFNAPSGSGVARLNLKVNEQGLRGATDRALVYFGHQQNLPPLPAPAIAGPSVQALPGDFVSLEMSGGQSYSGFMWHQVGGNPVEISDPASDRTGFYAPQSAGVVAFAFKVRRDRIWSAPAFKVVRVWGGQDIIDPVAEAGPDQSVVTDTVVTLDAGGSLVDPKRLAVKKHLWEQTSGVPVSLND